MDHGQPKIDKNRLEHVRVSRFSSITLPGFHIGARFVSNERSRRSASVTTRRAASEYWADSFRPILECCSLNVIRDQNGMPLMCSTQDRDIRMSVADAWASRPSRLKSCGPQPALRDLGQRSIQIDLRFPNFVKVPALQTVWDEWPKACPACSQADPGLLKGFTGGACCGLVAYRASKTGATRIAGKLPVLIERFCGTGVGHIFGQRRFG